MFTLKRPSKYNLTPWRVALDERLRLAQRAREQKKLLVIHLWHTEEYSTFRYRCYNVMRALEFHPRYRSVYFLANEWHSVLSTILLADMVVIGRVPWTMDLDSVAMRVKERRIPLLFDVDDLVFDIDLLPFVPLTLTTPFHEESCLQHWFGQISRIARTAGLADGFTTTTDPLGAELDRKFDKPHRIVKNTLNREQIEYSKTLAAAKGEMAGSEPYVIGYFSGSPTHSKDFGVVCRELCSLLRNYRNINLLVVGFMDLPEELRAYISTGRLKIHPLVDIFELQRLIAEVDLNISPLAVNRFTNCKSDLKYFEAAIVKTPTIASQTIPFCKAIQNGNNGFLCHPGEWYHTIEYMYHNQADIMKVSNNAFDDALQNFSPEAHARQLETAYDEFLSLLSVR